MSRRDRIWFGAVAGMFCLAAVLPLPVQAATLGSLLATVKSTLSRPAAPAAPAGGSLSPYIARPAAAGATARSSVPTQGATGLELLPALLEPVTDQLERIPGFGPVLDLVTYKVHTILERPDGSRVEKTVPAYLLLGVLVAPVDVDGNHIPDLFTEILPLPPNTVSVSFARTPTALAASLPLLAEVIVDIPGGSEIRAGFDARSGNMPLALALNTRIGLGDLAQGVIDVNLAGRTAFADRVQAMAFTAQVTQPGDAVTPDQSARVSLGLDPLPSTLNVAARVANGGDNVHVALETGAAAHAVLAADVSSGSTALRIDGAIDRLPGTLTLDVAAAESEAAEDLSVLYRSNAAIERVDASVRKHVDGQLVQNVAARMQQVPAAVDVAIHGDKEDDEIVVTRFNLSAPAGVGVIEAGVSNTGRAPFLEGVADPHYVFAESVQPFTEGPAARRTAVRVAGLRSASIDTGNAGTGAPLVLDMRADAGVLVARSEDKKIFNPNSGSTAIVRRVEARLERLPDDVHLEFSGTRGELGYAGAAPIQLVDATVFAPEGITPPEDGALAVKFVDLHIEDIPGTINLRFAGDAPQGGEPDDGSAPARQLLRLEAGDRDATTGRISGAGIGLIEATIRGGSGQELPGLEVPDGKDGVAAQLFSDTLAVKARVTGLKEVALVLDGESLARNSPRTRAFPVARLTVDKRVSNNGLNLPKFGQINDDFSAEVFREEPGSTFLFAEITDMTPGLELQLFKLDETEPTCLPFPLCLPGIPVTGSLRGANVGTEVRYRADQPIGNIDLRSTLGGLTNPMVVNIDELPTQILACFSKDQTCSRRPNPGAQDISFNFDASAPLTLNTLLLCEEPENFGCGINNAAAEMTDGVFLKDVQVEDVSFEMDTKVGATDVRMDTQNKPITGDVLMRKGNFSLAGLFRPVPAGALNFNGLLNIDIDNVKIGPAFFNFDIRGRNFPNQGQLRVDGLHVSLDGVNIGTTRSIACNSTTNLSAGTQRDLLDILDFDLTDELCQ